MVTSNPNGDHTQRYARSSKIRSTTDPGERFDIAKCAANLDDLIPGPDRRRSPEFQSWAIAKPYAAPFLPDMRNLPFMA
jgi:hypothetical protein